MTLISRVVNGEDEDSEEVLERRQFEKMRNVILNER